MVICKYQTSVSKDDKPFEAVRVNSFRTTNELEAHRIIKKWNDRGRIKSKVNVIWRYDFISCTNAAIEDWDNKEIPYHTESDC